MKTVKTIIAVSALVFASACKPGSNEQQQTQATTDTMAVASAPTETVISPDSLAIKFLNAYIKIDYKKMTTEAWLQQSGFVTDSYITEYSKVAKKQGSLLLVTGTENSCDTGYRIEKGFDEKTGIVYAIGGNSELGCDEEVALKLVQVDGKWLVDGSGLVNVPSR